MANIGNHIRLLRIQKQMTQDELAEKLFVSRQTISNYETGRSQPDLDMLLRISDALGVTAQSILYGTPDTAEQLTAKKQAIAASFTIAALAIVYHLLTQLRAAFAPRFIMGGLFYFLLFLLRPILFLLAGWTLMQLASVLTRIRPLRKRGTRAVFWTIVILLLIYLILILPRCGWAAWSGWEVWQLYLSGEDFNYSKIFSIAPWWDAAVYWITRHIKGLTWLFPPAGILLWLTGGSGKEYNTPSTPNSLQ